jgi:predicted subunit of tRNA(5-methylaminomethyl-2-thiouridylate) methyltransferase
MSAITPTSELDAVNIMLTSIGESPINTLGSGLQEAEIAEVVLDNVSRDVQSAGWHFNTEIRYSLTRNTANEINLPSNVVKVDKTSLLRDYNIDVVERGRKLYDRIGNKYTFSEDIEVDMVVLLSFGELPEVARRYITLRASRVYQQRMIGSESLGKQLIMDEQQAYLSLREAEAEVGDYNIFDNYDTYRALDRNPNSATISDSSIAVQYFPSS